jgi:ATP-dependent Clp endopeptidase proteolytic subunit ClpP
MIKHIKEAIKAVIAAVQEEEEISDKKIVVIDSTNGEPDLRVVGLFTDVVEEKIAEIVHGLLYMNALNKLEPEKEKRKDIEFYISTYGGSADDMFALYDIMKQVQKETDIVTIGMGKVMSAGVLLLAGGTPGKRKIGRNCRIMLHSVVAGNHGALHNLINEMEAIQDLQKMYINRLVEDTKMTKSQLKKMLERKVNIYLSAEEAIKYGIADIIV